MKPLNPLIKQPKILITGGSGFLGSRIVTEILQSSSPVQVANICIFDVKPCPVPPCEKVQFLRGDIRNYEEVKNAFAGQDIIIHTAAVIDWGNRTEAEVFEVNVEGTHNVIRACQESKVPYLVFTSSLDAIFGGKALVGIDESIGYPEKHPNSYCRSKFLSEKAVLAANHGSLKTLILRPADIYGEADPFHIGSLIQMAKGGFYVRLGNGKSKSQHVYVGNMAYAHVLACNALLNNQAVDGQVYFITDGESSNFFHFFDQVVRGAGYKIWPGNLWLPKGLAYFIGGLTEGMAWLMRPFKKTNPAFSRFAVTYTCTDFTFTAKKAEKELDFRPRYSHSQAMQNTIAYYSSRNEGKRKTRGLLVLWLKIQKFVLGQTRQDLTERFIRLKIYGKSIY